MSQKQLALVFTGGEYGEGCEHILEVLRRFHVKASFFVTGSLLNAAAHQTCLERIVREEHYLGPHSDSHPLYCSWENREQTLVMREFFLEDLQRNITQIRGYGTLGPEQPVFFIPPYEWFNKDQAEWSTEVGVTLFNYTPGTGSNRDWAPPGHPSYVPSEEIIRDILKYEASDPFGLNGFLLLLHLGSERDDKVFLHLSLLLTELIRRGYSFARVDQLLSCDSAGS